MSTVISIPRELLKQGELVIMPRNDYEEFLRLKKIIPLVDLAPSEKEALKQGRREIKQGKYLNLKQLKNELED